jgi:hyperosmotically inducible periplasmic protein
MENHMNIRKNSATIALCALLGVALAGCAATRTQRAPGEVVDDKTITSHVNSALSDDPRTKSRDIEVQTHRGTVQLNGFVDSADSKARAAELARNVPNVQKVDNNLLVRETKSTMGENIDDTVVTAKVKAALVGDPVTKARQIGVETLHGVVQLSGFVDTEAERAQATVVAKGVGGVHEVRNDLAIKQN